MTAKGATVTDRFVAAVTSIGKDALPAAVLERAKLCVLDLLGVAVAGTATDLGRISRAVVSAEYGGDDASMWASDSLSTPSGAALVNGTAAHALDYDDVITGSGHPSTVVVPAALAVAEGLHVDGASLLRAVTAGIESHTMLGDAIGPSHYARGFHSTATFGSFGAAAAAGTLRGLDAERLRSAFGIAGTQAAGLKSMFGTMCKPLHAGKAAANGVLAAALADGGFTSAVDVLGAPQGFVDTQADGIDADVLCPPALGEWRTLQVQFKMHAACYLTHASLNALRDLRQAGELDPREIDQIEIAVPPGHLTVCAIPAPTSGLQGKFSLAYTAALALLRDSSGQSMFTDEMVRDPSLAALTAKVSVVCDPTIDVTAARVTVNLRGGRVVRAHRDIIEVASAQPDLTGRLKAKFLDNVAPVLGEDQAELVLRTVLSLERVGDVRELTALLRPSLVP